MTTTMQGYLSTPKTAEKPLTIIVLQEIFGVNHSIKAVCDHFAAQGYTAYAPDIFWRMKPNLDLGYDEGSRKIAMDFYQKFDRNQGVKDIGDVIQDFRKKSKNKIAVLGFCLGGRLSYQSAARNNIDAAVCFYGGGIAENLDEAAKIKCPIQFHFGEDDSQIPMDQINRIREAFKSHQNAELYTYPNTDHAFYNADRPNYNKASAEKADERVLAFLTKVVEHAG